MNIWVQNENKSHDPRGERRLLRRLHHHSSQFCRQYFWIFLSLKERSLSYLTSRIDFPWIQAYTCMLIPGISRHFYRLHTRSTLKTRWRIKIPKAKFVAFYKHYLISQDAQITKIIQQTNKYPKLGSLMKYLLRTNISIYDCIYIYWGIGKQFGLPDILFNHSCSGVHSNVEHLTLKRNQHLRY